MDAVEFDFRKTTWRSVPSANAIFPNGNPVTYTILTEGKWGGENTPISLASGLTERMASYVVSLHNNSLATPTAT